MAIPSGYKIYWGKTSDSLNETHPSNPAYNSPINVPGGSIEEQVLPPASGFWDDSFTNLFFCIVAYSEDGTEGVRSKPVEIRTVQQQFSAIQNNPFSLPLDDGKKYTGYQLAQALGILMLRVKRGGSYSSYSAFDEEDEDGVLLTATDGLLMTFSGAPRVFKWRGRAWQLVD